MKKGTLSFIGLGLYDERDISIKGLEEINKADKVFAEFYTARLVGTSIEKLEKLFGKKIVVLNREDTEKGDLIIDSAEKENTVFLTAGDSMTATTHVELRIRAVKKKIKTKIIHGSSVVTAVSGLLGLQNYKFGRITTLAYPQENYFPISPYNVIKENKIRGLHTLVLLDIQEDKKLYMTANEGLKLFLKMEQKVKNKIFYKESVICVVAIAGSDKPIVRAGSIRELIDEDFGKPFHSIVVPGHLHFMEIEALKIFAQLPAYLEEKLQKI